MSESTASPRYEIRRAIERAIDEIKTVFYPNDLAAAIKQHIESDRKTEGMNVYCQTSALGFDCIDVEVVGHGHRVRYTVKVTTTPVEFLPTA